MVLLGRVGGNDSASLGPWVTGREKWEEEANTDVFFWHVRAVEPVKSQVSLSGRAGRGLHVNTVILAACCSLKPGLQDLCLGHKRRRGRGRGGWAAVQAALSGLPTPSRSRQQHRLQRAILPEETTPTSQPPRDSREYSWTSPLDNATQAILCRFLRPQGRGAAGVACDPEALLRGTGSGIPQLSLSTDSLPHILLLCLSRRRVSLKGRFGAESLDRFLLGSQAALALGFFAPRKVS